MNRKRDNKGQRSLFDQAERLERKRAQDRERSRRYRAKKRAAAIVETVPAEAVTCPAIALAAWAETDLIVPPGHKHEGQPMKIPSYFLLFFMEALADDVGEATFLSGRKNGKSAACAILILGCLVGPLRRAGLSMAVASTSREKANLLAIQCEQIATASGLTGLVFRRSPLKIESTQTGGVCSIISADKNSPHGLNLDLALIDELGLFPETNNKGRDLVAGLWSSLSAKNGRVIAISIIGHSPLTVEAMERAKDDPGVICHVYGADPDCALDDREQWEKANPGLKEGIKQYEHMERASRRALLSPADQSTFRGHELNQPGELVTETIVTLSDLRTCSEKEGERAGPLFLGLDIGGASSLTAAAMYWPETGRLETYNACGGIPDLLSRGKADGVGNLYERMAAHEELKAFPDYRTTPIVPFVQWLIELLDGQTPTLCGADGYKGAETVDALIHAGADWPIEWRRGTGGKGPDGFRDVRLFQKAVRSYRLKPGRSLGLIAAVGNSYVDYDDQGNGSLKKARHRGRIDCLSAAIIAVSLGDGSGLAKPDTGCRIIPLDDIPPPPARETRGSVTIMRL